MAYAWEITLEPAEDVDKDTWLAVADSDVFSSPETFLHDAMGDSSLEAGDTIYGRIAGPKGDHEYVITGRIGQHNYIEGLDAIEVFNKGVYTARAGVQIAKGAAQISSGNPVQVVAGIVNVGGGAISAVIGLASDDTTAFGNIFGWDDVEDAIYDTATDALESLATAVLTELAEPTEEEKFHMEADEAEAWGLILKMQQEQREQEAAEQEETEAGTETETDSKGSGDSGVTGDDTNGGGTDDDTTGDETSDTDTDSDSDSGCEEGDKDCESGDEDSGDDEIGRAHV